MMRWKLQVKYLRASESKGYLSPPMQLDPCILNLRFQGPLDSFDSTLDQKAQLLFLILALFDLFNENANQTLSTFTFGICTVCLTISVSSFSFWLLPNDEGMREL